MDAPTQQGLYDPQFEHDACGVGFVVDIEGRKSSKLVRDALEVLENLGHRGAVGAEENTGDGAGILVQTPDKFLRRVTGELGVELPPFGSYAAGMLFLPTDETARAECERLVERAAADVGQKVVGWRTVPVDNSELGPTAVGSQPVIRQVFVVRGEQTSSTDGGTEFERKLYIIRRHAKKLVVASAVPAAQKSLFYICSLSFKTVVYKGMLTACQLDDFFPDLSDPDFESALAIVHSRFSTNTFPSWARAHPYRTIAHNGEINTLRGNVNWMSARESQLESPLFGADISKIKPVIDQSGSDSAMLDNVLELLVAGGRELPHAVMMMVPEPWNKHEGMDQKKRDFYEFHSALMEPWDGPAAICFTDGVQIGTVLDRNGLRPLRYYVTKGGQVVMASEAGVIPEIKPEDVAVKGRIQPGRMFLVDTAQKRIISDEELKARYANEHPYGQWLKENLVRMADLPKGAAAIEPDHETLGVRQEAFGYTSEDLGKLILPMAESAVEPMGSMGTDTPLAVLSNKQQPLFNYFKQLFAQVTNPPVDAIREELIMAVETTIGPERNLFDPQPESARQIELGTPVLLNEELEQLRALDGSPASRGFKAATLSMLFPIGEGGAGLEKALSELCQKATEAVNNGSNIIV
ncbi:MAG TPA: glutamate synthase central domain-containing protein, partial [Polyangia bacterium]